MSNYKLSPSDLTFTWDECKFCFYMKVKHGAVMRTAFPGIFGKMANLTSEFYMNRSAQEISPGLPAGSVKYREKFVKSAPISFPGMASECYIYGRFDAVIAFDDGTYGIVDYKTSDAKEEHIGFYGRQLTAYAYALENPAPGALRLAPVSKLGLFVVTPERFERSLSDELVFVNQTTWMDVPRDDEAFMAFLGEIMAVLDSPIPPLPSETCGLCEYRRIMGEFPPANLS
ncbi:MAG: PD-(D/E)XK nuclease family protein [Anaerolineales bacterium]|nr:PD-(D/E)XK nuclease family protein [Anaerolineales bacterium]